MKKILLSVALMMATFSLHATDANYQVVPLPQSITAEKGTPFVLDANTVINVASNDEAMRRNGEFLKQYIQEATGIALNGMNKKGSTITLKLNAKVENEGGLCYHRKGVRILSLRVRLHVVFSMVYRHFASHCHWRRQRT